MITVKMDINELKSGWRLVYTILVYVLFYGIRGFLELILCILISHFLIFVLW